MSANTLYLVVKKVNGQKIVFVCTRNKKVKLEEYYEMVIQDKISINHSISQIYENLFYKYQMLQELFEKNILLFDHINYCQSMLDNMCKDLDILIQTSGNKEEILVLTQEILDTDHTISDLKFLKFQVDEKLIELNGEIEKLNQELESKNKLFKKVKNVFYSILECHTKYYNKFGDILCPVDDIFYEYMDDVD